MSLPNMNCHQVSKIKKIKIIVVENRNFLRDSRSLKTQYDSAIANIGHRKKNIEYEIDSSELILIEELIVRQ